MTYHGNSPLQAEHPMFFHRFMRSEVASAYEYKRYWPAVRFWKLPNPSVPHVAAWDEGEWVVVPLPSSDCGIHESNGSHCVKCALVTMWARLQPKWEPRELPKPKPESRPFFVPRTLWPFRKASGQ